MAEDLREKAGHLGFSISLRRLPTQESVEGHFSIQQRSNISTIRYTRLNSSFLFTIEHLYTLADESAQVTERTDVATLRHAEMMTLGPSRRGQHGGEISRERAGPTGLSIYIHHTDTREKGRKHTISACRNVDNIGALNYERSMLLDV